ncbi:unnamed protein product, partial [Brachionus calyciflorus]
MNSSSTPLSTADVYSQTRKPIKLRSWAKLKYFTQKEDNL